MKVLDIIFLIPTAYFAYKGFKKGLIIELSTLLALVLGVMATIKFSDFTYFKLKEWLPEASYGLGVLSYIVTFVAVVFAVNLVGKMISKMVDVLALGFINRLAGMLFGLIKAILLLALLILLFENINGNFHLISDEQLQESQLYPLFKTAGIFMNELISTEVGFNSHLV